MAMARIRTVKPEFFTHEGLFDLGKSSEHGPLLRLAFAGLWCYCDREGRFKHRPRTLKLGILPYDECDFEKILGTLVEHGYVLSYEVEGELFGWIPTFRSHQAVNNREMASKIPPHPEDPLPNGTFGLAREEVLAALGQPSARGAREDDATGARVCELRDAPEGELELELERKRKELELNSREEAQVRSEFRAWASHRESAEWDECKRLMRSLRVDTSTMKRIRECPLDDLQLLSVLRQAASNRRVRNAGAYVWGAIKKMLKQGVA